jgi:GNAT superfamily N-acetyltransferase
METARPARPEDLDTCADLLGLALDTVRTMRGGLTLVGPRTSLELLGRWIEASEPSVLLVGEFHGAVVGLAAAVTFSRPGAPRPSGRVECCYVEVAARGVGVGTALMGEAVQWCRDRGCSDVDALALPGDRTSKQRLEAAGFTARLLTLSRQLD